MRVTVVLVLALFSFGMVGAGEVSPAERVVRDAKAQAADISGQARVLARMAWPPAGAPMDPAVSVIAREQIVGFGKEGVGALRQAIYESDPAFSADIALALVQVREGIRHGIAPEYLPALDTALWFGTVEAKRLAMNELALHRSRGALLAMLDAAYEHPQLVPDVIEALVRIGDDRATRFLEETLRGDDPEIRQLAADALGKIGGRCTDALRDATLDEDAGLRRVAVEALLPLSKLDDLTVLYEYLALYPQDDAETIERIRQRASLLESVLERVQEDAAASSDDL